MPYSTAGGALDTWMPGWYIVTDDQQTEHLIRSYRETPACVKAVDTLGVRVRAVRPATWTEYLAHSVLGYATTTSPFN